MAFDKVVDSAVLNNGLAAIADAIRAKSGVVGKLLFPDGLVSAILDIPVVPVEPEIPDGYTRLDYIETTGTQCINTGFAPNQDTRVVGEFMYLGGNGIYGARSSTTSKNFSLRVVSGIWQAAYGSYVPGTAPADNNWHTVDQIKNLIYIDGSLLADCPTSKFTAPHPLCIGAINADAGMYYGSGKYRTFQIYDNGTLVRNMVPCVNEIGVVGMYDKIDKVFYGNAGTGEFIAGYPESVPKNALVSADGYVLTDKDGNYLIPKEDE